MEIGEDEIPADLEVRIDGNLVAAGELKFENQNGSLRFLASPVSFDFELASDTPVGTSITVGLSDTDGGFDPHIINARFHIDRLDNIQQYTWDQRNRLTNAAFYSTAADTNNPDETFSSLTWAQEDAEVNVAFDKHKDITYTYDVYNNRTSKSVDYHGPSSWQQDYSEAYIVEDGHVV